MYLTKNYLTQIIITKLCTYKVIAKIMYEGYNVKHMLLSSYPIKTNVKCVAFFVYIVQYMFKY